MMSYITLKSICIIQTVLPYFTSWPSDADRH